MEKLSLIVRLLTAALLLVSCQLGAQTKVLDQIKHDDFYGIYEMKGFGYFVSYKKDRNDVLELYDQDLKPVKTVALDFNVEPSRFMHGCSNGKAFLLTYFDLAKSKKTISAFDMKLNKTGDLETKETINQIFDIDESTFGILSTKGKSNYFRTYNNSLKQLSETAFGEGYAIAGGSLEAEAARSSMGMKGGNFNGTFVKPSEIDSDYFIVWGWDASMFKYKGMKLFAFDKKGNAKFEYPIDFETQRPFFGYVGGSGDVYLTVTHGNYKGKPRDWRSDGFETLVIDSKGKLKEKIKQEIPGGAAIVALSALVEKEGCVITCNGYSNKDGEAASEADMTAQTMFGGGDASNTHYEFVYFDNNGKYAGSQKAENKSSERLFSYGYFHTSQTPDQAEVYAVYYTQTQKTLSFHVAFPGKGKSASKYKSTSIAEEEVESGGAMGERVSINWFNVFDAEPGKVVVALYSAKKKAAYISKVDVTSL